MSHPFKPPFSYEKLMLGPDDPVYRIRDSQDNGVCRTYVEENAVLVVAGLNSLSGADTRKVSE